MAWFLIGHVAWPVTCVTGGRVNMVKTFANSTLQWKCTPLGSCCIRRGSLLVDLTDILQDNYTDKGQHYDSTSNSQECWWMDCINRLQTDDNKNTTHNKNVCILKCIQTLWCYVAPKVLINIGSSNGLLNFSTVVNKKPCKKSLLLTWIFVYNSTPAQISYRPHHKMWNEITGLFSNFKMEIKSNFIPHFTGNVMTYNAKIEFNLC